MKTVLKYLAACYAGAFSVYAAIFFFPNLGPNIDRDHAAGMIMGQMLARNGQMFDVAGINSLIDIYSLRTDEIGFHLTKENCVQVLNGLITEGIFPANLLQGIEQCGPANSNEP